MGNFCGYMSERRDQLKYVYILALKFNVLVGYKKTTRTEVKIQPPMVK